MAQQSQGGGQQPQDGALREPQDEAEEEVIHEFVKYSFFKLDRSWRHLPDETKHQQKAEFVAIVDEIAEASWLRSYSLVGLRADTDMLIRQISPTVDTFQSTTSRLVSSGLGHYLDQTHSYLAMTRESPYRSTHRHPEMAERDPRSWDLKYFIVYPMVKKRDWYQLPREHRQSMMIDHFKVGHKYPSIKINTGYSFGLDDQEFVVAFETDDLSDFLHLVEELRSVPAAKYTEREVPVFSSIRMPVSEVLETLGS